MPNRPPFHRAPFHKSHEQRERERKADLDRDRPSSWERGYDREWRRLRRAFLMANPWCRPATQDLACEVDHRVPIQTAPDRRLDWSNLQSLCRPVSRNSQQVLNKPR
jgi:5-methylcytosine-specific restriction endonuclease McrA